MSKVPLSILIPAKNEEKNIARCLDPIYQWADEIVVVDSLSTDRTAEIVEHYGGKLIQFDYKGGWPKKRQWAMDTYDFKNDWILLLDSDEILLDTSKREIERVIQEGKHDGFWIRFEIYFLGRQLRYGGTALWKLSLFRKGKGRYEKRIESQDASMADIEIHEHVVVDGSVGKLSTPVKHENINSLSRYIIKHNEYSNWEAKVHVEGYSGELEPSLFGNQAQRRRWLRKTFFNLPGTPLLYFLYCYIFKLGFLDGKPGFIYAYYRGIQTFHTKSKIYELEQMDEN